MDQNDTCFAHIISLVPRHCLARSHQTDINGRKERMKGMEGRAKVDIGLLPNKCNTSPNYLLKYI